MQPLIAKRHMMLHVNRLRLFPNCKADAHLQSEQGRSWWDQLPQEGGHQSEKQAVCREGKMQTQVKMKVSGKREWEEKRWLVMTSKIKILHHFAPGVAMNCKLTRHYFFQTVLEMTWQEDFSTFQLLCKVVQSTCQPRSSMPK